MTQEQKQEKKKHGLVKRIFKWIGLSILVLIILLALFVEAPKKLVILLLIILAAFTALPKPARKWFWLGVGAVVLILIIWIFLPEDNEGWRPYTFEEEIVAFEAKYAIPDEENAAFDYDEILENSALDSNQPDFFIVSEPSSLSGPWLSKDHPETAEWIKNQQDTIDGLMQVTQKEKCIFLPTRVDPTDYSVHLGGLYQIRQCIFLILSAANNNIAEERIDAGIEKYLCVLRMADHFRQQPTVIDPMVGLGMEDKTLPLLNRFMIEGKVSEEQLQLLIDSMRIAKNEWKPDWTKMLNFEYLYAKNSICGSQYEVNPEGKMRLGRSLMAFYQEEIPVTYIERKFFKAGTIFRWFVVPSTPQKAAKIFDRYFERYYAMTEPEFDWTKQPQIFYSLITKENFTRIRFNFEFYMNVVTDMFEENYYGIHKIYMNNLTLRRGSRLLIAIKQYYNQHSDWPPDLDSIKSDAPAEAFIDPVTGNPLQYENHGERFSLYGETANVWPK